MSATMSGKVETKLASVVRRDLVERDPFLPLEPLPEVRPIRRLQFDLTVPPGADVSATTSTGGAKGTGVIDVLSQLMN